MVDVAKGLAPNRDSVTTIRDDGSRMFLHPADARGRFARWRTVSAWLLIALFVALPWIQINGHPAVLLDVMSRRFHLFGMTFAAQDLWLMFFLVTGMAFGLFYVTAVLGRVWCGWACPQTVYLEHVYRRVERWLEGDATKRRKLDRSPWNTEKILRRGTKHLLFVLISAVVMHIFLAYFVSLPSVWQMMHESPAEHLGLFAFVMVATGLVYLNFAWFREQLCIVICPYGRLQSALIDDHTINVGYDETRGEPRGKPSNPEAGDCIDCHRCVQVCPTGIDIRQGLQLECIGCTACIDACDEIMDKLGRDRGLIRYDSLAGFSGLKTRFVRARTILYTVLLLIGATVAAFAFRSVEEVEASVTRMRGSPFYVTEEVVRNQYELLLLNKGDQPATFRVNVLAEQPGMSWNELSRNPIPPLGEETRTLVISVKRDAYEGPFVYTLELTAEPSGVVITKEVSFAGPSAALLKEQAP